MPPISRKKGLPPPLRIHTPPHDTHIALTLADSEPSSTLHSAASDSDPSPFRSHRNMKKLSITLPSAHSSSNSLHLPSEPQSAVSIHPPEPPRPDVSRPRRPSIISLPSTANPPSAFLHRKEEDGGGSPTVPYADGPTQIIPGVWLGSEDNARDWKGLVERGIKSILNVAKEVTSPFDSISTLQPLRSVVSTPNFKKPLNPDPTYYPPHLPSGRPAMHYLKLQWSHGQQDLVDGGFQEAMAFTDAALDRGEGVLIHCQCGISRSATMVIALVMRAAAEHSHNVPPEVWALKGMQGAYSFVKEKSKWVGPNMSLIYQLLEYEKRLKGDAASPGGSDRSSLVDEEEEWGRRRKMLDDAASDNEDERESALVMQEARALDKAMEDRIVARKASASSIGSSGSGVGMGVAWRSRYAARKRTGSIASNMTNGSIISEDLVEEEEEQELLGIGGGFDEERRHSGSSATTSPGDAEPPHADAFAPRTARPRVPPSAPVWKTSFQIPPPPATAVRASFDLPPLRQASKPKRRPAPIGVLPTVPSSPVTLIIEPEETKPALLPLPRMRKRTESRKLVPPPLHLRNTMLRKVSDASSTASIASTPSQTLFVFPPSPTLTTRTPSTMTLTTNINASVPFPSLSTPRVSTFRSHGRTRSFIGLAAPPTPTTGFSKVDARGYVGLE
ncbi:hypothetical protein BDQ12DRAFT_646634 [Crucibulum laeve]|uniref:protein-tyrosine-phosphatase n=1 Tax=Crucibulum laeve TaxID=68775 RepID=A0A5C3M6K7_9AGAR|nr:hypothetical protein BDQ12DRAFT_646634 [Crucibulum laeve]